MRQTELNEIGKEVVVEWHYKVYGRVQGVGYRKSVWSFVEKKAKGLKGFVRNCEDGTVEIVAQGDEAILKALEEFCYQGPLLSKVKKVEVERRDQSEEGDFKDFSITS